ncbi:cellulase (glycosyl hydrolase family 5) [Cellulophaga sp. RHA19]|uniref:glycoside hydrolase family 2 TIM barrel-domain containing protein n=1 Tax=Cellulophaga sp. RHA19 TaxID=1798237 RepID=UPI000C2C1811|nr:glycoside hydrolase family 2 TIM barrel-domain containing protein [Cellulophaga sp. RHA19]PKB42773.1 cellulase (glycosyl hydrolase family 5) [Cellulophaga sp. RHA19]
MKINKIIYRALLLISFIVLNGLILVGISAMLSYLNTGADRTTILHIEQNFEETYSPKIIWNNITNEGRPIEDQTLNAIENDYKNAWNVRNIALATNNMYGVDDFYTTSARAKIDSIISLNIKNNTTLITTSIQHNPTIDFYSADGKLVVFTDNKAEQYNEVYSNKNLISSFNSAPSYKVMMLLEDGFWRIRHLEELEQKNDSLESVSKLKQKVAKKMSGINYYPKNTPWDMFGKKFDTVTLKKDFALIQSLKLNTIRIFVPYEAFGKATVDTKKLMQLEQTLDIAQQHKLKVIVTLFDFYGNYDVQDWTLTHRHAEQIVNTLKNHPALVAWDIKNEPDLDFESRGKPKVMAWLKEMIKNIKKWDSKTNITVGWSSTEAAENLVKEVDFVSFHYYKKPEDFLNSFKVLKNKSEGKELVLQEYGYSSYSGIWNFYSGSNDAQADYYKEMQGYVAQENIPFVLWTLYDFETIPTAVVGRLPWRKSQQKHFGLFSAEGKPKKALDYIKPKK